MFDTRQLVRGAVAVALCLMNALAAPVEASASEAGARFDTIVAPSLVAKCVACHRPDNLKGGFDMTTREGLLKGGESGSALSPGRPVDSPIYMRSISPDGRRPEMPEKGDPLTAKEAEAVQEWIAAGAPWPEKLVLREKAKADASFWSFQPIADVVPPPVNDAPTSWTTNPVDRFLLAKLREQHLLPNPVADARAFIRRATYDLTGLPPTPEEVDAFLRECPDGVTDIAVETLVNRLLDRPQYGEQWGRHWLDVIRFGESRGYERNEIITNLWPFRDYIIQSFNDDKPFDRLVLEHLAGDVVGRDQPEVEIGSAFLVAGPYDDVGNQDPIAAAQIRADQMDEMIRVTGEAFLGMTIGCARCHDHKFDPLATRDYYALSATFAGTVHGPREVSTASARDERTAKLQPLQTERDKMAAHRASIERSLTERAKQHETDAARAWTRPRLSRYGTEETFGPVEARFVRLLVDGTDADNAKQSQFKLDEFEVWTAEASPRNVALASSGASVTGAARDARDFAGAYSAQLTIDGKFGERWHATGRELVVALAKAESIGRVVFSSDRTKTLGEDHALTTFVGDYRVETSMDGKEWELVASSEDRIPPTDARKQARLRKLVITPEDAEQLATASAEIERLDAQVSTIPALPVWWVGTHKAAPGPFHVFVGGNPQRPGDEVTPASLGVLSALPSAYRLEATEAESARRLALAKWLTAPDNPLTPRVLANRVWQFHFGQGIVDTPSDFGYMGSRPTHRELLDWLARELLRNGWKLKPLHRLIMTSQAYRQSATWREDAARIDADSRLVWRFPPRRMSGEEIRDTLLQVVGKLNLTMRGPGFRLYEYQQDNVATYVPLDVPGPETYRRAVYHHNARAARVDVLSDFDCPDPAFAEPRRAATTTPLQALTLMNHRFSLDMAQALAERLEREATGAPAQVRRAFALSFSREPSDGEVEAGVRLIQDYGLRAFCRAVLNANELIHVN